jgi:hypothetical protein
MAAEALGVPLEMVRLASFVRRRGTSDLIGAVERGELDLSTAANLIRYGPGDER